jgi:two-component system, LytTR family, sensor kinase
VEDFAAAERAPSGPPPVSVHFVNNVLAAAASSIEDDPDQARDVLALVSQFLTYRLRGGDGLVPVAQELDHVATYLRLEQARFPDRLEVELPRASDLPDGSVPRAAVQAPLSEALSRRLGNRAGPCQLTLRVRPGRPELDLELGAPGEPPAAAEHVRILLAAPAVGAA